MSAGTSLIKIRGLSKVFKTDAGELNVLEDINLDIMEGEIFGIIGMSGAGKSTLVRCLNFLEKPTKGTVYIDNQDLSCLSQKELYKIRQSIGMIFQQFNLLMQRNVLKNVCFPLEIAGVKKKEAEARAYELLELVGLSDKAKAYPSQLSGGQKQRVAIARALANNPKVILCDEATSALDPATTKGVLALLKDINKRLGITIVIITHEMSVVEEVCQRVAIIDSRHIAEVGYVHDIFTKPTTDAARRLVFPEGERVENFISSRCCRIVFNGSSSFEPVIANMVLEFRQPVNIIFADTRNIDGKAFGQIVIQLPEDKLAGEKMMAYLRNRGLTVEEVKDFV
ncbi:MAG TPA: ATP-binding cassette domain-containing protein [Thermoclostridium sp.]|nr:ATP-binding cassette domain-containing protein [Clostridiaceae bacterium]HOQ75916.1 ATP-binding cassette domain-containing protein [Thermoclostridium sp.]